MKEELSSELVSALLGLFAHDLRNPLSALHSNVSFLASVVNAGDTEAHEALEDVAASSDALARTARALARRAFRWRTRASRASRSRDASSRT